MVQLITQDSSHLSPDVFEEILYVLPDEGVPHNTVVVLLYNRLELLYVAALIRAETDRTEL